MSVQSEITRIANEVGLQTGLIDQIAAALEGKAAGGGGSGGGTSNTFTFTPAETGLIRFTVDIAVGDYIVWYRSDSVARWIQERNGEISADLKESFYGITWWFEDSFEMITSIYPNSVASSYMNNYTGAAKISTALTSSTTQYGAAVINKPDSNGCNLSFYVNSSGNAGLRVGGTYIVHIIKNEVGD